VLIAQHGSFVINPADPANALRPGDAAFLFVVAVLRQAGFGLELRERQAHNSPGWWAGHDARGEWVLNPFWAWHQALDWLTPSLEAAVLLMVIGTTSWRRFCSDWFLSRKTDVAEQLPGGLSRLGPELGGPARQPPGRMVAGRPGRAHPSQLLRPPRRRYRWIGVARPLALVGWSPAAIGLLLAAAAFPGAWGRAQPVA